VRFPRGGGRALRVHGPGSFHGPDDAPRLVRVDRRGSILGEAPRADPNRVRALEMSADQDAQSRTRSSARLRRNLEGVALEEDRVVPADHPLFLVTQDLLEIDAAQRHERTGDLPARG